MSGLLIVHTESSCGWGGQELRIIAEAQGLGERGHQVLIAAPSESRILDEAARRGLAVHALPIGRKSVGGVLALRGFLALHRAHIVNSHSSTDSWLAAFALRSLRGAPRLVRTRHISAPISADPATRWLYRSATCHVVTTGERLREQVMREAGLAAERVTSVPTGIDLARYTPGDRAAARAALGLPRDGFIIGMVATLRSWKGHRYLVDAYAAMHDPVGPLVMVGDGPGMENLRAQVRERGIEARVRMPGNQADVVPWLRALDVLALPSYANEGVPQAIMQAMACGIPVVATPAGAIGEIVRDGHTGLMVAPQDPQALRLALERMRREPALRQRLAAAALEQARAAFGASLMLDRMESVFRAVAHAPAAALAQ